LLAARRTPDGRAVCKRRFFCDNPIMLIPQFSIRTLLILTAVAAVISLVLQQAVAGALWAQCAGWTFVFIGILFAAYAGLFLLAWGLGQMTGTMRHTYTPVASPFASVVEAEVVTASPFAPPSSGDDAPPSSA
jgi:hypothetical protein